MTEPRRVAAPAGPGALPDDAPRILIDSSEYWLRNMGDLAMLDVTIQRLRARWPHGRIGVLTETPALLRAYFPGIDPIDPWAGSAWRPAGRLTRSAERLGPRVIGPYAIRKLTVGVQLRRIVRVAWRSAEHLLRPQKTRLRPDPGGTAAGRDDGAAATAIPGQGLAPNTSTAAAASSLVLALGGGYLTDADPPQSARVLDLLDHAHHRGVPAAMLGQGIGPIESPGLLSRAAEVLPEVDLIAVRERRSGPALLQRVGVPPSHVLVTGDDAIELAYSQRPERLGRNIGVCLRVAGYSPVSVQARVAVGTGLRAAARALDAALTPVIISEFRSEDRRSTLPLVDGHGHARRPPGRFARPQNVVRQVGTCRVMVTGAYHAGVFALSQGIPVVALTSSEYYDDKFLGLADMFGGGLDLVRLAGDDLPERLHETITRAWAAAPEVGAALLISAAEQIALSRAAFRRVCDLV